MKDPSIFCSKRKQVWHNSFINIDFLLWKYKKIIIDEYIYFFCIHFLYWCIILYSFLIRNTCLESWCMDVELMEEKNKKRFFFLSADDQWLLMSRFLKFYPLYIHLSISNTYILDISTKEIIARRVLFPTVYMQIIWWQIFYAINQKCLHNLT